MHEFATAQKIVRTVVSVAIQNNAKEISEILLELGELTFVNPEQLKFVFKIAADKTIAKNAKLNIVNKPGAIKCKDCGYEGGLKYDEDRPEFHSMAALFTLDCPKCGSKNTEIIGGRELTIKNIKVV
ncbi:MAG: hydrogenase maturation nickel metallochaperone HypA [Candidatus Helarchaeota archaeon]